MMEEYINDKYDGDLPEAKPYEDYFEQDLKKLKKLNKDSSKEISGLVKTIKKGEKMKKIAMSKIDEDYMKNSCFKKNLHLIQASFELDEFRNKNMLHQYVENLEKSK
jgi:hypothetical protein